MPQRRSVAHSKNARGLTGQDHIGVTVSGETKFVCVDGPEFDGHGVDFDELLRRQRLYQPQERESYEAFLRAHGHEPKDCRIGRYQANQR